MITEEVSRKFMSRRIRRREKLALAQDTSLRFKFIGAKYFFKTQRNGCMHYTAVFASVAVGWRGIRKFVPCIQKIPYL